MIDLVAPGRVDVADLGDALGDAFTLAAEPVASTETSFYDTFDGLLREAGITFELPRAGSLPSPLPDAVRRAAGVRALLPIASVATELLRVAVLDELEKTVVRITLSTPVLLPRTPRGRPVALGVRVALSGVRGYDDELHRVHALLVDRFALQPADGTLRDEAVIAGGGRPEGTPNRIAVPLRAKQPVAAAAGTVMRALLEVMLANQPGLIADTDTEFLHDYRVSLRRARTVMRECKDGLGADPETVAAVRGELRWLQQMTGEARDLDVHVLDFDDLRGLVPGPAADDLGPLLTVLQRRRLAAHRTMVRELRGERATAAIAAWRALIDDAVLVDSGPRIGPVASARIRKVYRRMVRMGEAILAGGEATPPEDYHELRKQGKELRYLLELFGLPLRDPKVVKPMIKALKRLQDVLGRHQDREVQLHALSELSGPVSSLPGGDRALMAMGLLLQRLDRDAAAAREEFAEVFAAFASTDQRRLVTETFRA